MVLEPGLFLPAPARTLYSKLVLLPHASTLPYYSTLRQTRLGLSFTPLSSPQRDSTRPYHLYLKLFPFVRVIAAPRPPAAPPHTTTPLLHPPSVAPSPSPPVDGQTPCHPTRSAIVAASVIFVSSSSAGREVVWLVGGGSTALPLCSSLGVRPLRFSSPSNLPASTHQPHSSSSFLPPSSPPLRLPVPATAISIVVPLPASRPIRRSRGTFLVLSR